LIVVAGAIDGALRIAALIDLARRPASEVRGSKAGWAVAVALVNSLGAVPVAYFAWGRRRPRNPAHDLPSGLSSVSA